MVDFFIPALALLSVATGLAIAVAHVAVERHARLLLWTSRLARLPNRYGLVASWQTIGTSGRVKSSAPVVTAADFRAWGSDLAA